MKTLEKIEAKVAREKELAVSQAHYVIDALATIKSEHRRRDLLEDVLKTALSELEIISPDDARWITVRYSPGSKLDIYLNFTDEVKPLCELYWDGSDVTIARFYIAPRMLGKIIVQYNGWKQVEMDIERYKPWKEEED